MVSDMSNDLQIDQQIDQQIGLLVQKDIFIKIAEMVIIQNKNAFLGMWLSCKWAYNNIEIKRIVEYYVNSLYFDNLDKHLREKPEGYPFTISDGYGLTHHGNMIHLGTYRKITKYKFYCYRRKRMYSLSRHNRERNTMFLSKYQILFCLQTNQIKN